MDLMHVARNVVLLLNHGTTAKAELVVLALVLFGILLILDKVPVDRRSTKFYSAVFCFQTYHRSMKWSNRLVTIGPTIETVISDQPIRPF